MVGGGFIFHTLGDSHLTLYALFFSAKIES